MRTSSFSGILAGEVLDLFQVLLFVGLIEFERFLLSWAIEVWLLLQKLLNAQQNRLHTDARLPVFLLVEDGKAHSSRGVNVGMRQKRLEYALGRPTLKD